MGLDPQCGALLERLDPTWSEPRSIDALRRLQDRKAGEFAAAPAEVASVAALSGAPTPTWLYRPLDVALPRALVVYIHGGGWVGGRAAADGSARALAAAAGCAVAAIHYRLAPEHPFPAALEDCYAGVSWLAAHAAELLGVGQPRLAVAGESAGANLAAAVALLARDRSGPPIDFQLLICPATDAEADTWSKRAFARDHWLTADALAWCWEQYLATPLRAADPYASVLRAPSLASLPAAHVVTAECDVVRDEGEAYAARLREHGVPVTAKRYAGMLHGFVDCDALLDAASVARAEMAAVLRGALA